MTQAMPIYLKDVLPLAQLTDYKIHFAKWNQYKQPLDVFTTDRDEWRGWQEHRSGRDDFNRKYIFSLASFYHEPNAWLFGGVFMISSRHKDRYEVELTEIGRNFIGRLKLHSPYNSRGVRVRMENHYESFKVVEVLREEYSGRAFPGFEEINLSFAELETLVKNGRGDWKAPLESVKGIYLITDLKTNKRYVGSAYSEGGLWSRWCGYVDSGHGWNVELRNLVTEPTLNYCRENFRFALLEHRSARTSDHAIIERETFWKKLLLTRGSEGLNRN